MRKGGNTRPIAQSHNEIAKEHPGPAYTTATAAAAAAIDGQGQMAPYVQPADESSMWGASVGFGMGEWASFLDVVARPEGEQQGQ